MPAPITNDLRERVVEAFENGEGTAQEIAERFCVTRRSVHRWLKLKAETGSLQAKPMGGSRARGRRSDGSLREK